MGQQFTERAAGGVCRGVQEGSQAGAGGDQRGHCAALLCKSWTRPRSILQQALALDPDSAQAWYNLGLAEHAGNELEPALASFQQAVKLDPRDADSFYYRGRLLPGDEGVRQGDRGLREGAEDQPAARLGGVSMARALQRSGRTAEAKEHFKRFQHLTSTKICSADRAGLRGAGALLDGYAG